MNRIFLVLFFAFITLDVLPQNSLDCYRIFLADKQNSSYSVNEPERFLSQRAIDKRTRFNIPITIEDLPVSEAYIQQILTTDTNIRLLTKSKWNNSIVIYCPDESIINSISLFPYVNEFEAIASFNDLFPDKKEEDVFSKEDADLLYYDYGMSYPQIGIHHGDLLHELSFRGEGMLIAVLDAGWTNFNHLDNLASLRENGQIIGVRDLQPDIENVYIGNSHGTAVTSIMGATIEGQLVGSAPLADYFFIRSENPWCEQWIEEDFWAEAAEIADSIGADVINSSLGYTTYENLPGLFSYANSDGLSSVASHAATIAVSKGIIVCVSAGNSGDNTWHYVGRPADAVNILTVGAVNKDSVPAPFTSVGPSYDGRIKPDVASVGWFTAYLAQNDTVYLGHGTSYASPVIAGLAACLWQALPDYSAPEIMQMIRKSGHQFMAPDTLMGHGIPDFYKAYSENLPNDIILNDDDVSCSIFPNPSSEKVFVTVDPSYKIYQVSLYDSYGRIVLSKENGCGSHIVDVSVKNLQQGVYFIHIFIDQLNKTKKSVVKKIIKL